MSRYLQWLRWRPAEISLGGVMIVTVFNFGQVKLEES